MTPFKGNDSVPCSNFFSESYHLLDCYLLIAITTIVQVRHELSPTCKNCPPKNLDEMGISPGSSSVYLSSVTCDSLKVTTSLGKDQITLDSDAILCTSPESGLGHTDVPSV